MNSTLTATTITQEGSPKTAKNHFGWKTESYFKIEGGENDGRYVKVYTSKTSSGLMTSHAQVCTITPANGSGYSSESFMMFQDPSMWLNKGEKVRATDKTCLEQHLRALETLKGMSTDWVNGK